MESILPTSPIVIEVTPQQTTARIDQFLTQQFATYSRTFFQKLIDSKLITINGKIIEKYSAAVKPGDVIHVTFPAPAALVTDKEIPPGINVQVVYEHKHFLIINKPAGLIVHAPAHDSSVFTLVDWLINHFNDIASVGSYDRPGIVHRLDKDTSGLLIIPRTNYAHMVFGTLFRNRHISKTYYAIVKGRPAPRGTIDTKVGRHPVHKHKMAAGRADGRHALTHYKVLEYFTDTSLLEVTLITGRTHQIRVHLSSIEHPILGDSVYGTASEIINRQALHAGKLEFVFEREQFSFSSPLPEDMQHALQQLRSQAL